jgi:hypothetical protein
MLQPEAEPTTFAANNSKESEGNLMDTSESYSSTNGLSVESIGAGGDTVDSSDKLQEEPVPMNGDTTPQPIQETTMVAPEDGSPPLDINVTDDMLEVDNQFERNLQRNDNEINNKIATIGEDNLRNMEFQSPGGEKRNPRRRSSKRRDLDSSKKSRSASEKAKKKKEKKEKKKAQRLSSEISLEGGSIPSGSVNTESSAVEG